MKLLTQENWVINRLNSKGCVTRNEALQNYISRLGAIVERLNKAGWDIKGTYLRTGNSKDYVYTLIKKPEPNFYQKFHAMMQSR